MRYSSIISAITAFFSVLVIVSYVFNTPLFVAYLKSESMHPTLNRYDVIFINPLDRNFNDGDIIIFKSGDEWICHRIVGAVSGGFITKGDNNVASDQFSGKGMVYPESIAGKVVVVNGIPLKIPLIGEEIQNTEKYIQKNKIISLVLFITGGFFLLASSNRRSKKRQSLRIRSKNIFAVTSIVLIILITFISAGVFEEKSIDYGTTVALGNKPSWVRPGEKFVRYLEFKNKGLYPYYYTISSDSKRVELMEDSFILYPNEERVLQVVINAPEDTSLYSEKFRVAKYIPILPASVIEFLSDKHPYLPILAMDALFAFLLSVAYLSIGDDEFRIKLRWKSLKRKLFTEVF